MNKFETERAAADKITQARAAEDAKVSEANRTIVTDAYTAVNERQSVQRTQRIADFTKGEYANLDELLAAARKM